MTEYGFQSEEMFFERLGRYVSIETPSADPQQMQKLNQVMEQDLTEAGAVVIRHQAPRGDLLEASVGQGPHRVLLLGHKDTVFPTGTYEKNPYRREEREGVEVLRGPGVLDMKAGDVMIVELLRHFSSHPVDGWRITALFNSDEEIGSGESEAKIRELARESDFAVILEPSVPKYCTVARKGLTGFNLTAHGVAAHSGINYLNGASAVEGLCRVISRMYDLRDDRNNLSVNIGSIRADGKANIIADTADAVGEVRCYDPELMKTTLEKLRAICETVNVPGVTVDFTIRSSRPPMKQSDQSRELFEIARKCAESHGLELTGRTHGGGSDGSFIADEGIPVIDGMGGEGENSHTSDEYLLPQTAIKRLQTVCDTITQAIGLFSR